MECRPGYFGIGCHSPCPKGLYGERCAGKCFPRCPEDECDRIHGCPYVTNVHIMATTVADNDQFVHSSNVYQTTEENMVGVLFNGFNSIHLLAGLGTIISLFLFVIIIQLCKRSGNSERRNVSKESCIDVNTTCEKLIKSQQKERKTFKMIPEPIKGQNCRPCDTEYEEIHEDLETFSTNFPNVSLDYEQPQKSLTRKCFDDPDVNRLHLPINDVSIDHGENESASEVESLEMYLKPIFAET